MVQPVSLRRMFFAICTLAALRLTVAPVHTQAPTVPVIGPEPAPVLRPVDDVVLRLLEQYAVPGAVVGIVRDGRLVFLRGYGYADPTSKTGVELDSQFRIASVTKPLTATAILKLVEQGKVSLDTLAFDILRPSVPVADARIFQITVRHLLEHKGGWDRDGTGYDPMFRDQEVSAAVGKPLPIHCPDIIQHMMGRMLDFDPGSRSSYSNFGYCVLGQVIEKLAGVSYDQYVTDNILKPLDMTRSQPGASGRDKRAAHEVTYVDEPVSLVHTVLDSTGKLVPIPYGGFSLEAMIANGGWISSAADILRFAAAESGARPPSVLASPPPGFPSYVPPSDLGFGWYFNGALVGTAAVLVVDNRDTSGHRTDFCVLMNSWLNGDVHGAMRTGILDVLKLVGVNDWPWIDLFRSRFEPSDAQVELLFDGTPGSKLSETLSVQMKGDPVAIDIQADANAPWLSVGAPSAFAPTSLTIGVRPDATLAVGDYYAWVTVSAPLAENRLRVRVHLHVPSLPPSVPASLTLNPTSVKGGSPSSGMVRLDRPAPAAGTVVTLTSGNPAVASVPTQVIVSPGGQSASFTVVSNPVATSTPVTITAMAGGVTKQATLTVLAPVLDRLAFPASIVASDSYNYYSYAVFLDAPAPSAGVVVKLASSAPTVALVPASVTIPAGALGQSFSGSIRWVRADTPVTFTATAGSVTRQATMTVLGTSPVRVSLGQNPITGGYSTSAYVSLVGCFDGSVLNLASSNTAVATLPRSVKVYRAGCGAYVEVKTKRVSSPVTVTITANYGADRGQAMLAVLPPSP